MLRKMSVLALAAFSIGSVAAADLTVKPLQRLDTAELSGYSMLVRKDESVLARVDTGEGTSEQRVWWLVFNNPDACASRPCTVRDIYRKDTRADLIPADEEQRSKSAQGDICLKAGSGNRSMMPRFGMPASGLADIGVAEVQLIVAEGGREIESWIRRMSSDTQAGCAAGSCGDLMIAVHAPAS